MPPLPLPTFRTDSKSDREHERSEAEMIPRRRSALLWIVLVSSCCLFLGYKVFFHTTRIIPNRSFESDIPPQQPLAPTTEKRLIPLEAHIMSKCPDAKDCLKMMVLPTMQKVVNKVNFTLSFIGTPTDNDGVSCKHGPEECMGNIIELCAARLYPDPKTYLGFTMCITREYESIPQKSLIEDCALEHGLDFKKLGECAVEDDGGLGVAMLRASVRRSTQAGVTTSCTVRLDEEIYCVRDGGEWKDCPHGAGVNDLVLAVEKMYREG